jgi:DNA mismatch repair protein MutS2
MYAETTEAVRNSAMEFDEATLEPTYRLIEGLAGQSSGLRIAERFGLPQSLIASAGRSLDRNEVDASRYVDELRRRVGELEDAKRRLEGEKRSFEDWKIRASEESARERRIAAERAEARLKEAVADIRRQAAEQLKLLGAGAGTRFKRKLEKAESEAGARIRKESRSVPNVATSPDVVRTQAEFREGMKVQVISLGVAGAVLRTGPSWAEVLVGNMKMRREFEDLEPVGRPGPEHEEKLPANVTVQMADNSLGSNELKLIGKTYGEAQDELDKFLDDAFLSRFAVVRIVHGHGMGVLRKTVREVLAAHPHVERFEAAPAREGGDGATLAYLRD